MLHFKEDCKEFSSEDRVKGAELWPSSWPVNTSASVFTSFCTFFRCCHKVQQLCQLSHLPKRTKAQHSSGQPPILPRPLSPVCLPHTSVQKKAFSHQALWMMEPKEISDWQHEEFYRYVAQSYDKPRYTLHYRADAPLNIRSIFYVPEAVRFQDFSQAAIGRVVQVI